MKKQRLCSCGNPMPSRREILKKFFLLNLEERYLLTCEHCNKKYMPTLAQKMVHFFMVFVFAVLCFWLFGRMPRIFQFLVMPLILFPITMPYILLPWQEATGDHLVSPAKEFRINFGIFITAWLCAVIVFLIFFCH